MPKPPTTPPPLLSVRATVILLLAVLCGAGVAVLTYLSTNRNVATALLAGFAAAGGAVGFLHKVVGHSK
jgi:hypothetical protein